MKSDWDRRTCARKGHVTYAPDDPRLRVRLHAQTALGDVLRVGADVAGMPQCDGGRGDDSDRYCQPDQAHAHRDSPCYAAVYNPAVRPRNATVGGAARHTDKRLVS